LRRHHQSCGACANDQYFGMSFGNSHLSPVKK
jgi:hypothetical protein